MKAVTSRNFPDVHTAARAQDAGAGAAAGRRFSQAPVSDEAAHALLGSIDIVEALGTVLDLAFLVDDVSDEERDARTLIAAIVASAARIIKAQLDA